MEDGERPSMSERNAENVARFKGLPAAGNPAYWAALENATKGTRLDLEILAMCARERRAAGKLRDVVRIYEMLIKKTEARLNIWVNSLIPTGARDRARIIEDVMQECALGLWQELDSNDETFLTRGFWVRMWRMTTNIATQARIKEGLSARSGSVNPTRVPQRERDSLDKPIGLEDSRTVGDTLADPQAEDEFSWIELVRDVRDVRDRLTSNERLLLQNEITHELTQAEMAKRLGKTDRTVRLRLEALRAKLRALLNPPGDGDGGATAGGEEGRS